MSCLRFVVLRCSVHVVSLWARKVSSVMCRLKRASLSIFIVQHDFVPVLLAPSKKTDVGRVELHYTLVSDT